MSFETRTHYDLDDWKVDELVDLALNPPFDMEAADWKALAAALAERVITLQQVLDRF